MFNAVHLKINRAEAYEQTHVRRRKKGGRVAATPCFRVLSRTFRFLVFARQECRRKLRRRPVILGRAVAVATAAVAAA